eukprot:GABV01012562.1.p2 GENE.GABV01012562.1~~GABV01012562.1.p2  ORF type:complete len:101 (-),score=20.67 GABV01012562.1:3-305(-)
MSPSNPIFATISNQVLDPQPSGDESIRAAAISALCALGSSAFGLECLLGTENGSKALNMIGRIAKASSEPDSARVAALAGLATLLGETRDAEDGKEPLDA